MKKLLSKIQFSPYEIGEFTATAYRTYEEALSLMQHFPWEEARKSFVVGLTGPSVTIEGQGNDFLKMGLYYNNKFVAYYCRPGRKIYKKVFLNLTDMHVCIHHLYQYEQFNTKDWKPERTVFSSNGVDFITKSFSYKLTPGRMLRYLLTTSAINLLGGILLLSGIWALPDRPFSIEHIILFPVFTFIFGGINIIFFVNHYIHARGKVLILSNGSSTFRYGNEKEVTCYQKTDVESVTVIEIKNSKHPLSSFAVASIKLKRGKVIKIPALLMNADDVARKLHVKSIFRENKYPFMI